MEVGDYVRTKKGNLGKIIFYHNDATDYYYGCYETNISINWGYKYLTEYDRDIKTSPNIIDLIEVGDYVNGDEIHRIFNDYNGEKVIGYIVPTDYGEEEYRNEDIKSIVTKEQFESVEYRIGDKN